MNSLASFMHLHPNILCTNQRLVCAYCTRAIDVTRSAIPNPSHGPSWDSTGICSSGEAKDCSCQIHVAVWLLCCMSLTDLFTQAPQILQALLMYVVHLRQLAMWCVRIETNTISNAVHLKVFLSCSVYNSDTVKLQTHTHTHTHSTV